MQHSLRALLLLANTAFMNKLFALRIFSKRVPLAATVEPPPTPVDWEWNALDIARRAAKADDLEHVPSIKGIADIFTRMLEQLQVCFMARWYISVLNLNRE
jgi:hypothetical protein